MGDEICNKLNSVDLNDEKYNNIVDDDEQAIKGIIQPHNDNNKPLNQHVENNQNNYTHNASDKSLFKVCDELSPLKNIVEDCLEDVDEKPSSFEVNRTRNLELTNKTGVIYDEKMKDYWCTTFSDHPERPKRTVSIYNKLVEEKLIGHCVLLKSRKATEEEILLKHDKKHFDTILSIKDLPKAKLQVLESDYDSIYFHKNVTDCSLLSAGCTIEIVEQVVQGVINNGAAIVRPPGHHALTHCSMGFCHFNNVAIAAMVGITKYNLNRILIVDWDVHYGNGIHKMFEDDARVLYFSMHRYDNNFFWPGLIEGNYDAVGIGKGEGYNIHVPWNTSGMGDADYLCAFQNILMPIAKEYEPELILVSSGFDSGKGDPLGGCKVTPNGYAHMTKQLMSLSQGKIVIVLEGGYNLKTLADSMFACVTTLLGKEPEAATMVKPCKSSVESIKNTFNVHQKYWKCLQNVELNDIETEDCNTQAEELSDEEEDSTDYIG